MFWYCSSLLFKTACDYMDFSFCVWLWDMWECSQNCAIMNGPNTNTSTSGTKVSSRCTSTSQKMNKILAEWQSEADWGYYKGERWESSRGHYEMMMKRLQGLAGRICWDIGLIQRASGSGRALLGLRRWDNIKHLSTTFTPLSLSFQCLALLPVEQKSLHSRSHSYFLCSNSLLSTSNGGLIFHSKICKSANMPKICMFTSRRTNSCYVCFSKENKIISTRRESFWVKE